MELPAGLLDLRTAILAAVGLFLALAASLHALFTKRDPRSTVAWVGLVWLAPGLGVALYLLLGVNRIERKARRLRGGMRRFVGETDQRCPPDDPRFGHLARLATLGDRVAVRPLVAGNGVEPLAGGDRAYPRMLAAIDDARRSIALSTYIFENDDLGRHFVEALGRAVGRGVSVRVLVDAAGIRFSPLSVVNPLRAAGVPVARFLPGLLPWRLPYLNLRNHRKILVVDGRTGFTGGMNITGDSLLSGKPRSPVEDVHFQVTGPVVRQLLEVFAEDWAFTTGEVLRGPPWAAVDTRAGQVLARGVADGPDEDLFRLPMLLQGALASAEQRIRIVTPYFLPPPELEGPLEVAALRGVRVDIVVPRRSDVPPTDWAMQALAGPLLGAGVHIWRTPPPFDHAKLMVVDDRWCMVGSGNWDTRSLRLNFELNLECWDPALVAQVDALVEARIATARPLTLASLSRRRFPVQLRDSLARLGVLYL